jgi:hypothetical protein
LALCSLGYFLSVSCDICLEDAPLHAQCLEGQWLLACATCDSRDED